MSLKLTYFPAPGRAFVARTCFGIGGIEYENETIPFEQFSKMKEDTSLLPMG